MKIIPPLTADSVKITKLDFFFSSFVNPRLSFLEPCRVFSLFNRLTSCADTKLQEKDFHARLQLLVAETLSNVSSEHLSELSLAFD